MDWVIQNWWDILTTFSYIVTAASFIAKFTPSKVDDEILDAIRRFLDFLALNRNRAKITEENS
jgi:hypothetical protein